MQNTLPSPNVLDSEKATQQKILKNNFIGVCPEQKTIVLASPRGFCAGVDRAIEIVERSLQLFSPPLYVNHEIVHNKHVVENLKKKGVIFTEDIDSVPNGETVIFSAHGVAPDLWQKAKQKNLRVIDATCPLVTKVHLGVHKFVEQGYFIVYIGHKKHAETIGTIGEAPDKISIVETVDDIAELTFSPNTKLAYLTQTTLSLLETQEIIAKLKEKFPQIKGPAKDDICYATTNRQKAVAAIAPHVPLMLVIGSQNSSNSNRLREVAERQGCMAYLIDDEQHIQENWFNKDIRCVGLTAGASAPEVLMEKVIARLQNEFGFFNIQTYSEIQEHISFRLPSILK